VRINCIGLGAVLAVIVTLVSGAGVASDSLVLGSSRPVADRRIVSEREWAFELVRALGLERTLPPEASERDVYALLCADRAEREFAAGSRALKQGTAFRVAFAPERPRTPHAPVRAVVHVPSTALYQLSVEGSGLQRWVIDGHPVGHLDVSPLGVAQAGAIVPLQAGPHELSGYMAGAARADRVELVAYRPLCIAPADGWHGDRALRHGAFARTLVRSFDLDRRLPSVDSERREIEAERFDEVTAGGGATQRSLDSPASAGAWAIAEDSPAEFSWSLEVDTPRVVTLRARTFGVRPQLWSVDGRYRVTVEPTAYAGNFAWNHVITLPLSKGRHVVRALVSRGAGIDVIEFVPHRSTDADYAAVLTGLGLRGDAPVAPIRASRMRRMVNSSAFAQLALGFRLRMAGDRRDQSLVLVDLEPESHTTRPLSPLLPAEF
jgi:hypothetical protein